MSHYTLLPEQSALTVFNDVRDVIEKAELSTDFTEHKQIVVQA